MRSSAAPAAASRRKRKASHLLADYDSSDDQDDGDHHPTFHSALQPNAMASSSSSTSSAPLAADRHDHHHVGRRSTQRQQAKSTDHHHAPKRQGTSPQLHDLFDAAHMQLPSDANLDLDPALLPRAYEITLNYDQHLRTRVQYHSQLDTLPQSSTALQAPSDDPAASSSLRLSSKDRQQPSSDYSVAIPAKGARPMPNFTRLVPFSAPNSSGTIETIWTDRYDAVHLLAALPAKEKRTTAPQSQRSRSLACDADPASDSDGWSDLPSDSEDLFFFTASEASDYLRDKKRNRLDQERQRRLAAILARDGPVSAPPGSDEALGSAVAAAGGGNGPDADGTVPSREQYSLMQRTAKALLQSNKATVLEMKILANHGSDPRFAFLRRGREQRWRRVWERLKAGGVAGCDLPYEAVVSEAGSQEQGGEKVDGEDASRMRRGLLVGYDSDSGTSGEDGGSADEAAFRQEEVGDDAEKAGASPKDAVSPSAAAGGMQELPGTTGTELGGEDEEKRAAAKRSERLERARQWAKQRREQQQQQQDPPAV